MVHESLESYYRLNMKLFKDFGLSIDSIEEMFPFEREVYVALIIEAQEKANAAQ